MKKLIILSLLSIASISNAVVQDNIAIRAIRATKNTFRTTKSYIKETASDFGAEIKDIAQEVGAQFKEVGHDIYDATLAPAFTATKKTAASAANKAKQTGSKIGSATRDTYNKAVNSHAVIRTKQMATEAKEQITEVGQTVYENGIKTPAITAREKAAAIATAIKEKIVAAKNATAQVATEVKNSEFGQDMADVGAQFKEAAYDATDFVKEKSTRIWDSTKATVQEIQEELAA